MAETTQNRNVYIEWERDVTDRQCITVLKSGHLSIKHEPHKTFSKSYDLLKIQH